MAEHGIVEKVQEKRCEVQRQEDELWHAEEENQLHRFSFIEQHYMVHRK